MKKYILLLLILLNTLSCASQRMSKSIIEESKELMISVFSDFENKNSKNNKFIENKILINPSINNYKDWKELILKSNQLIKVPLNSTISDKKNRINYSNIFTKKDFEYINKQINDFDSKKWIDYLGFKPKEKSINKNDSYPNRISKSSNIYYLTQPVFNTDFNFAMIYQENGYGGVLITYQKINDKWLPIASSSVWVN